MVKGCQRKTIHIRDTGSKFYEEAYLILRPGALEGEKETTEMIEEAMRIVGESLSCDMPVKPRHTSLRFVLCFASGCLVGAILTCCVQILMNIMS